MESGGESRESSVRKPASGKPVLAPEPIERLREMGQALGADVPRRILELFLADAATRLSELRRSVKAADATALEHTAHSLKGSSANLGALAFADLCHELEERSAAAQLAGAEGRLLVLEAEYRKVEAALRQVLVEFSP